MDETSDADRLSNAFITQMYVALFLVELFCFSVLILIKLYHRVFGTLTTHNYDHKTIELKEVVVVVDEVKVKEVSKNCTECAICLEKMDVENNDKLGKKWVLKQCGHKFHEVCMTPWFYGNYSCPTCRRVLQRTYFPSIPPEEISIEA